MESFPLKNFWDHVIIVNTWADTESRSFKDFMKKLYQSFRDKINSCENLKKYMKKKKQNFPKKLKNILLKLFIIMKLKE